MGKRKLPRIDNLVITDMASEGKSLGKHEGKVIFVPLTAPGDVLDVQVIRKRKKYLEAVPIAYKQKSMLRTEPFCQHFGVCGGCKWQHLPYAEQLKFKEQQVLDHLVRIGKCDISRTDPIIGADENTYYRNKLEFTFSDSRWLSDEEINSGKEFQDRRALGFHVPGMFDRIVDIDKCYLQSDPSNEIRNEIKSFAYQNGYTFFNHKEQTGLLRNLIIRNTGTGQLMVIVVFYEDLPAQREKLMQFIASRFSQINSLLYIINQKANDTIPDQDVHIFKGADCIYEQLEELTFKIGPKSFFQTNSRQALQLYSKTLELADLSQNDTVYDLYTGTGSIALFMARHCKKIIGIEYVPEAIDDARENAEINSIANASFFSGDMKEVLNNEFLNAHGKPQVIITDPPRAGMHKDVLEVIKVASPDRIVYVSCNSATQARDIELLSEMYEVTRVQPVDMFPHTHHVENIVLLKKR
ncbi:MAG: 23S rRNA (uracil(1939)-C(5))-methyltransferase RlmD [Bacteroidetes bacterium]|jgi:23S rRNA (uracil1939-C5)-methyltransferase|nr:23S rRNA (uracil(1939)-C(5))-methyltransferase RlmD [Bacteroidota bacterium]